jgi:hypothetical protein
MGGSMVQNVFERQRAASGDGIPQRSEPKNDSDQASLGKWTGEKIWLKNTYVENTSS